MHRQTTPRNLVGSKELQSVSCFCRCWTAENRYLNKLWFKPTWKLVVFGLALVRNVLVDIEESVPGGQKKWLRLRFKPMLDSTRDPHKALGLRLSFSAGIKADALDRYASVDQFFSSMPTYFNVKGKNRSLFRKKKKNYMSEKRQLGA